MNNKTYLKYWRSFLFCTVLCIASFCLLVGCEGTKAESDTSSSEVQDEQSAVDDGAAVEAGDMPQIDMSSLAGEGGIDVDLTKLSSTMVYSVVYDMTNKPNNYIGKTVRMSGNMSVYEDENSGNTYYACIIKDAAACCAQGIEFITDDDYPSDGSEITVAGVYDLYEDDGYEYCVLRDAVIES